MSNAKKLSIEVLGTLELVNNSDFNYGEFAIVKSQEITHA
jgi:hypothetical protein